MPLTSQPGKTAPAATETPTGAPLGGADAWIHIAQTCACHQLRRSARLATQHYEAILAPVALSVAQFSFMVAIRIHGPVSLSEVARYFLMDRTTLYRNVRPLLKRELVREVPGPDRRTKSFVITPGGAHLMDEALPLWERAQAEFKDRVGHDAWQTFTPLLAQATIALAERPT